MMKRNVLATLVAALLVIGLLGLATAQGATAGADVELIAEQHVVLLETLRVPIQTRVA
jgi:F0F1-type ATP synthase membrane subunit c/vacuolar-type H+-ATPase subunit K